MWGGALRDDTQRGCGGGHAFALKTGAPAEKNIIFSEEGVGLTDGLPEGELFEL